MDLANLEQLDLHNTHEEIANSVIHGVGALLAAAGLIVLVVLAARMGDPWRIVSFSIYGTTLVLLYVSSTLFHALTHIKAKRLFRIFDYAAIYLLIAGSATPLLLVTLRGPLGWTLFGIAWGVAIIGVLQTALALDRFKLIGLAAYLGLGWLMAVAWQPLLAALQFNGMLWLIMGGAFYTLGVVFFVVKRIPHHHAIWHLFVLAGSVCHYVMMYNHVLPE